MQVCFNYIHNIPVKAGLVKKPEDWEFSSYADIIGLRNGTLANRLRLEKLGLGSVSVVEVTADTWHR